MDSEDERDLYQIWAKFDKRMTDLYDKECMKFLSALDKTVREKLGWRRSEPENLYDRFEVFMEFVRRVYLTPSLYWDDCSGSDSDSLCEFDRKQEG